MFNEQMTDNSLVMNEQRKKTLKALAKSIARQNKHNEQVTRDWWSADFAKGKGSGLAFLLHGNPGTGKTCTAECIAAFTRRPLMTVTSSDMGSNPGETEKTLTSIFRLATSWDVVLLIDEADVFMERRESSGLMRNGLVAAFLRALEYYNGILFLTTNRVGAFDDAFASRVHVQLYYRELNEEQRQQVWQTFIHKLARERGDYIRVNIDAKEYIRSAQVRAVKWNGREIRNAIQTAVALAEYDSSKDEGGRIILSDAHLRPLIELSKDFKDYVDELHMGDAAKRAARRFDRIDQEEDQGK
ncbi:hypothetical protein MMC10_002434 [Thelotrema lepadinum]|nr:hypothetical protein [Thelotrema lepadinum]